MENAKLPLRHLSVRVPWHDKGWDGSVCTHPADNTSCLRLSRINDSRDDNVELATAEQKIDALEQEKWPACVSERGMFMAPFEYTRHATHPYTKSNPDTHGHFSLSPLRHPPYTAAAVPFRWMFRESMKDFGNEYEIDVDIEREPELKFDTTWVQEIKNQTALLDCFFNHIKPEKSLCFFYAKQIPLGRRCKACHHWYRFGHSHR